MRCDCCKKEFTYEDDIQCENGYLYHKECDFNPYGRRRNDAQLKKVFVVYATKKGEDLKNAVIEVPWIYGVFYDEEKAFFVQEYMQKSKDYGHLYWGNHFTLIK